jgi:hypothetical protein
LVNQTVWYGSSSSMVWPSSMRSPPENSGLNATRSATFDNGGTTTKLCFKVVKPHGLNPQNNLGEPRCNPS